MSTCGSSLRHIFDSTIPENTSSSSLIETLSSSLKQIRPVKPLDHSFTEIFGELHFKENTDPFHSSSSASPWQPPPNHKRSDSLNSESLQLCTEGLGFESLDSVEDLKIEFPGTWLNQSSNTENDCNKDDNDNENNNKNNDNENNKYDAESNNSNFIMAELANNYRGYPGDQYRKRRSNNGKALLLPPPISCIRKTGKPGVSFQSYREDGRFVLKEVKIPTYERLQSSREDGRLRMSFIPPADQEEDDGASTSEVVDDDDDNGGEDEGGKSCVVGKVDEYEGKGKGKEGEK